MEGRHYDSDAYSALNGFIESGSVVVIYLMDRMVS